MRHLRLGILISGGGTTMENIAAHIAAKKLNAEITTVIASNHHCAGIEKARRLNLPVSVITRKESGSLEHFSARIAENLREAKADLVLMAGFLSLWQIPPDFAGKVMNIHPALLPKFGGQGMHGIAVHSAVLAAHETESGCTVHFADNHYDAGPIILQKRVPVDPADTPESLAKRVFTSECQAYPKAIEWFGEDVLLEIENNKVFLRKVLAYITREKNGHRQLLVFDHANVPTAGTQVVHGTMHHGEIPEAAVLREATEETGLQNLCIEKKLGIFPWISPAWNILFHRHVFHLTAPTTTPDTWQHYETDGGQRPETPDHLFTFRWIDLTEKIDLAADQSLYLASLCRPSS